MGTHNVHTERRPGSFCTANIKERVCRVKKGNKKNTSPLFCDTLGLPVPGLHARFAAQVIGPDREM